MTQKEVSTNFVPTTFWCSISMKRSDIVIVLYHPKFVLFLQLVNLERMERSQRRILGHLCKIMVIIPFKRMLLNCSQQSWGVQLCSPWFQSSVSCCWELVEWAYRTHTYLNLTASAWMNRSFLTWSQCGHVKRWWTSPIGSPSCWT